MLYLDFAEAWAVYLRAGSRLPAFPGPVTPRAVSGLLEIAGDYDLLVFDAYGVLHEGGEGFPDAIAVVSALHRQGKPMAVLTNDVTREPTQVADGLRRRGYPIADDGVISGRSLLPPLLAPWQGRAVGLISSVPEAVTEQFPDLRLLPLATTPQAWAAAEAVLMIDTNHWDAPHAEAFLAAMAARPRPLLVCNPDVGCPFQGRISAEPGYFAHLAAERHGVEPLFVGKPFPQVFQRLHQHYPQVPPGRMLMIGDSPHTDVLGARAAGMACLLVGSGFLNGRDLGSLCAEAGLMPDFIAPAV